MKIHDRIFYRSDTNKPFWDFYPFLYYILDKFYYFSCNLQDIDNWYISYISYLSFPLSILNSFEVYIYYVYLIIKKYSIPDYDFGHFQDQECSFIDPYFIHQNAYLVYFYYQK